MTAAQAGVFERRLRRSGVLSPQHQRGTIVSHVTISTSKRPLAFPDVPHDLAMQLVDLASQAC